MKMRSMSLCKCLSLFALCLLPAAASAVGRVDVCLQYGRALHAAHDPEYADLLFDPVPEPRVEVLKGGFAAQGVSTVVTGYAALLRKSGGMSDVRFHCQLDDQQRVTFFHVTPDKSITALRECRHGTPSPREISACLRRLDAESSQALARALTLELDAAGQIEPADARRRALDRVHDVDLVWMRYRDSECGRWTVRGKLDEDAYYACRVDLARERLPRRGTVD